MSLAEHHICFGNEELTLNNVRSVYWKRKNILILSDLHLGKAAHFRKNGIAMPVQSTMKDLSRLEHLILHYHPGEVIVVGDLLHAGVNTEVELLKEFIAGHPDVRFTLIRGNHDRVTDAKLQKLGISGIHSSLEISEITLLHEPVAGSNKKIITGHIHPGIRLRMPTKGFVKFPCFWVTEQQIILPAFSRFTGLDTREIPGNTSCYAVDEKGIFEI